VQQGEMQAGQAAHTEALECLLCHHITTIIKHYQKPGYTYVKVFP